MYKRQTFLSALTALVDTELRGDKECPFSGVTSSGSLEEGAAGKRRSECGPICGCAVAKKVLTACLKPRHLVASAVLTVQLYRSVQAVV